VHSTFAALPGFTLLVVLGIAAGLYCGALRSEGVRIPRLTGLVLAFVAVWTVVSAAVIALESPGQWGAGLAYAFIGSIFTAVPAALAGFVTGACARSIRRRVRASSAAAGASRDERGRAMPGEVRH
jgi:hypothetical protein